MQGRCGLGELRVKWGGRWRVGGGIPLGGRKRCRFQDDFRGEKNWRFLPDGLYFSMKLNYCFLCVLFLFCYLFLLRVRNYKVGGKDLEPYTFETSMGN